VREKKAQMRAGVHIIAHQVEPCSPARPALGSTHGANPPLIVTLWPGSPQQAEILQAPAKTRLSGLRHECHLHQVIIKSSCHLHTSHDVGMSSPIPPAAPTMASWEPFPPRSPPGPAAPNMASPLPRSSRHMAGQTAFSFETAETAVHFRARVRVTLGKGKGYPSQGKGYPRLPGVESLSTPGSSLSKHVMRPPRPSPSPIARLLRGAVSLF
jgi:hypothetical protein